jgi:ABC-type sugar transport system substrate-binding protein
MKFLVRTLVFALFITVFAAPAFAQEKPLTIGFLSGGDKDNQFWNNMIGFAGAVAEDLNIDLIVEHSLQSTYTIKRNGLKLIDQLEPGTYFVTPYIGSVTADLLKAANDRDIKVFIINIDVLSAERESVGKPRAKFANWIAHSYADDVQAGYLAADAILAEFPATAASNEQANVKMVGLTGPFTAQGSFDRNNGLKNRISQAKNAMLYEIQEADFQEESAKVRTKNLLAKYPSLNAIWTASDGMAMGAIDALKEAGKKPGKDVVVAGIDWTQRGLNAVKSGELVATVGGHFMEAGMALVLIYDHHHGKDFAEELGTVFETPMYTISKGNIDEYLTTVGMHPDWAKIDFKRFSKTYNKDLQKYDFSWQRIVENMKQ